MRGAGKWNRKDMLVGCQYLQRVRRCNETRCPWPLVNKHMVNLAAVRRVVDNHLLITIAYSKQTLRAIT